MNLPCINSSPEILITKLPVPTSTQFSCKKKFFFVCATIPFPLNYFQWYSEANKFKKQPLSTIIVVFLECPVFISKVHIFFINVRIFLPNRMPNYWASEVPDFFRDLFIHFILSCLSYLDVLAFALNNDYEGLLLVLVVSLVRFLREVLQLISCASARPRSDDNHTPGELYSLPTSIFLMPDVAERRLVLVGRSLRGLTTGIFIQSFMNRHPHVCGIAYPCLQCAREQGPTPEWLRTILETLVSEGHQGPIPSVLLRTRSATFDDLLWLQTPAGRPPTRPDPYITHVHICTNCQAEGHLSDDCLSEPHCSHDLCFGLANHREDECHYGNNRPVSPVLSDNTDPEMPPLITVVQNLTGLSLGTSLDLASPYAPPIELDNPPQDSEPRVLFETELGPLQIQIANLPVVPNSPRLSEPPQASQPVNILSPLHIEIPNFQSDQPTPAFASPASASRTMARIPPHHFQMPPQSPMHSQSGANSIIFNSPMPNAHLVGPDSPVNFRRGSFNMHFSHFEQSRGQSTFRRGRGQRANPFRGQQGRQCLRTCNQCGSNQHFTHSCPIQFGHLFCLHCSQRYHSASECPRLIHIQCHNCGRYGHTARYCQD